MEELEEERQREKEKQRREDTREEEELEEERRRDKEELEEERLRAKQLATLEADRILAKARGTQQLGEDTEEGKVSANAPSNLKSKPEQGGPKPAMITETKSKTQLNLLPPHKSFGAFISHKKASWLCLSLQSIAIHLIVLFRRTLNSAATLSPFRFV